MKEGWAVKFVPFALSAESSFWVRYGKEKLDTIRLSEAPIPLLGSYGMAGSTAGGTSAVTAMSSPRLELRETSFGGTTATTDDRVPVKGSMLGYNTVESFQKSDKNKLLKDAFVPKFLEGRVDCLTSVVLLNYADLKNHKVVYWAAYPALLTKPGCSIRATKQESATDYFGTTAGAAATKSNLSSLHDSLLTLRTKSTTGSDDVSSGCPAYFLVKESVCYPFEKETYHGLCDNDGADGIIFGFMDPTSGAPAQTEQPMGWPMRNLVAYLSFHLDLGGKTVRILSFRPTRLRRSVVDQEDSGSLVLHVTVPTKEEYGFVETPPQADSATAVNDGSHNLKAVGWETNTRGKPGPRSVNLRPLMDSTHLAIQAADLNLKLMKWRMIPDLNVDMLQSTKVLLLGAGTLGCNVARVLLGWGIRDITFVDYGKVSYSNPVRQSLFSLKDCEDGGRPKAQAAADALKTIAADVHSEGHVLSIPMPGHSEDESVLRESIEKLEELMLRCDVVYLLTDTRESRWLPTVMAAAHDKMMINAALGLDSWLVMRHGGGHGCYFCNDVVAPENSMKNRTLDQQCTVTRPGLAPIASAMAVELMVAMLHHPLKQAAPAPGRQDAAYSPTVSADRDGGTADAASPLGVIPHQIRGSLVSYSIMIPAVPEFDSCTGCSDKVIEAYRQDKVGLMRNVAESTDGKFLEDLSGLTAFRADAAAKFEDLDEDDDDEWGFDD